MFDEAQLKKIEELLSDPELTVKEVAAEMGVSYNTFRLRLATSGMEVYRGLRPIASRITTAVAREREEEAASVAA